MKQVYCGELDPTKHYAPGSIVRTKDGAYKVRSHSGVFVPVAAPPDASLVGPPGRDGVDGAPGADGRDGERGADGRSINWRGPFKRGRVYHPGDAVSLLGESWIAIANTNARPGVGKDWQLMAARGEDGADGRDGASTSVVRFRRETVAGPQLALTAASDFAAGDAAYAMGDGRAGLAIADGEPQTLAIGLALVGATSGWPVQLATSGLVTCPSWSWPTPGATLYLSPDTPGGMTTVYPTAVGAFGAFVVVMGTVVGPTQVNLNIHWANYIGA